MQERVYEKRIQDVDDLRECVVEERDCLTGHRSDIGAVD